MLENVECQISCRSHKYTFLYVHNSAVYFLFTILYLYDGVVDKERLIMNCNKTNWNSPVRITTVNISYLHSVVIKLVIINAAFLLTSDFYISCYLILVFKYIGMLTKTYYISVLLSWYSLCCKWILWNI